MKTPDVDGKEATRIETIQRPMTQTSDSATFAAAIVLEPQQLELNSASTKGALYFPASLDLSQVDTILSRDESSLRS